MIDVNGGRCVMERVLYFQQNIGYGACEHYIEDLACLIDKTRYDVWVLYPDHSDLTPFRQLIQHGVNVVKYPCDLLTGSSLVSIYSLLKLFRSLRPRVIHFNDPCVNGILAARLARIPIAVMTHHTPELNRSYNWKGRLLEWLAFKSRLHVVFTSEPDFHTGITRDHVSSRRCQVIPLGIDMKRFTNNFDSVADTVAIRQELGIPSSDFVVGNVARLAKQKGHRYLIMAARQVLNVYRDVTFVIAGEGILRDELVTLSVAHGCADKFVFLGYCEDVPKVLSTFDVFVNPSIYEGLCLGVVEAAAMSKPVVATDVGGVSAVIRNGKSGTLVQPRDSSRLAHAIMWMMEHPVEAKAMGREARLSVVGKYSKRNMVQESDRLYQSLLAALPRGYGT